MTSFDPRQSHQRARLTALHPGGRAEVLHQGPSPSVWALYTEIRERGLLPDTTPLRIEVTDSWRSPFLP